MKICVCVKAVPDTEFKVELKDQKIDFSKAKWIISPYDENALEEALRFKKDFGAEVIAVSLGGPEAEKPLRDALALTADRAVHLQGSGDLLFTATSLAKYFESEKPDLVLFGKEAIDNGASAVGQMVASLLNQPFLSLVSEVKIEDKKVIALRDFGGGNKIKATLNLPCVLTADKSLNTPKYPSLPNVMKAKKLPVETSVASGTNGSESIQFEVPTSNVSTQILTGSPSEMAQKLVDVLRNKEKCI